METQEDALLFYFLEAIERGNMWDFNDSYTASDGSIFYRDEYLFMIGEIE